LVAGAVASVMVVPDKLADALDASRLDATVT
jgi:hypothetical protein